MASTGLKVTATEEAKHPATTTLAYDPEYWAAVKSSALASLEKPEFTTVQQMRDFFHPFMTTAVETAFASYSLSSGQFSETKTEVTSFDGAAITLWRFAKPEHRAPLAAGEPLRPAVLAIHGGAMVCNDVAIFASQFRQNVDRWGVQIFAVDYRLAPESPAPGPVEDSYAALKWLSEKAVSLGIDPARLVLYGDSAGGGISAGTAILARDRGLSPPVAKQVLIYPMLDDRTIGRYGPDWPVRRFLGFAEADNKMGWECYVGANKAGKKDADVSIYAAPGRARVEDVLGLPKTYIDTGSLDLFRDEDLEFAQKLLQADVEVELHIYPGVPHGFEYFVTPSVVAEAHELRKRAVRAV